LPVPVYPIPSFWNWPAKVRGVFVGGCIEHGEGKWRDPANAAHSHLERGMVRGWICLSSDRFLLMVDGSGRPNPVLTHEAGHVITEQGHTQKWAATVRALGGVVLPEEVEPVRRQPGMFLRR
jgi:hypothetical protein